MWIALTREVSPAFDQCELTHLERQPIDVRLAQTQHHAYENCLSQLGCAVYRLPAEPDLPDSVFVEDTAVVVEELAIITRPGAESRRLETASMAKTLSPYRKLVRIQAPGTLDGGDVLRVGRTIYVGSSSRSNPAALEQMRSALAPFGYTVQGVPVNGCLHLKSAVTRVGKDTLLINRDWVEASAFGDMKCIEVDEAEPSGGNGLLVNDVLIYPANYPKTLSRLRTEGIAVKPVDVSEVIKAEGGVTCCSVIFSA